LNRETQKSISEKVLKRSSQAFVLTQSRFSQIEYRDKTAILENYMSKAKGRKEKEKAKLQTKGKKPTAAKQTTSTPPKG
jgi:hypothetical protein